MGRRVLPGPSIFYLAPGSSIYNEATGGFREEQAKRSRSSCMSPVNPLLPRDTLYTFMEIVRFINFIKHLLDRNPGLSRLSDILEMEKCGRNAHDSIIMRTILLEKRFIAYDKKLKDYAEEQQDRDLVSLFFSRAKGSAVKGFKTGNSLIFDI
jgi:hypothetical protein